jgi:hypothetical protein
MRYKLCILMLTLGAGVGAAPTTYYVDNAGSDDATGTTMTSAWKSVYKVSNTPLEAGSTVLFKRGGQWRDSRLLTQNGVLNGAATTYGAYGTGDKPRLMGSVSLKNPADWQRSAVDSNIWISQIAMLDNTTQNINGDFATNLNNWIVGATTGIGAVERDTAVFFQPSFATTDTASVKIRFTGTASATSDISLSSPPLNLAFGHCYRVSFWAKASKTMPMQSYVRVSGSAVDYTSALSNDRPVFETVWTRHQIYLRANRNATDGRIRFYLGQTGAAGETLNIDAVSVQECDIDKFMEADVGNLIFDSEQAIVGTKVMNAADLNQNGKFWYDDVNKQVWLQAIDNPALVYPELEAAIRRNVVDMRSMKNVTVRDLDIRNTGGHGVQATGSNQVTLDNLDISYAGGSLKATEAGVRYGNGIEIFQSAKDVIVTNNKFSQIYDSAMTGQGFVTSVVSNVKFHNNFSIRSEHCYELVYQDSTTTSIIDNVVFTNNTCVLSGHGWGHVRAEPEGVDGLFYNGPIQITNAKFNDNILSGSINTVVRVVTTTGDYHDVEFSGNCYWPVPRASAGDIRTGILLFQSLSPVAPNAFKKRWQKSEFEAEFGFNTNLSFYEDPQLNAAYIPTSANCLSKGYQPNI